MSNYSDFGLKAREIMFKKKITVTSLAKELGISTSYLSEIFKGTRNGSGHKEEIIRVLGMN